MTTVNWGGTQVSVLHLSLLHDQQLYGNILPRNIQQAICKKPGSVLLMSHDWFCFVYKRSKHVFLVLFLLIPLQGWQIWCVYRLCILTSALWCCMELCVLCAAYCRRYNNECTRMSWNIKYCTYHTNDWTCISVWVWYLCLPVLCHVVGLYLMSEDYCLQIILCNFV